MGDGVKTCWSEGSESQESWLGSVTRALRKDLPPAKPQPPRPGRAIPRQPTLPGLLQIKIQGIELLKGDCRGGWGGFFTGLSNWQDNWEHCSLLPSVPISAVSPCQPELRLSVQMRRRYSSCLNSPIFLKFETYHFLSHTISHPNSWTYGYVSLIQNRATQSGLHWWVMFHQPHVEYSLRSGSQWIYSWDNLLLSNLNLSGVCSKNRR